MERFVRFPSLRKFFKQHPAQFYFLLESVKLANSRFSGKLPVPDGVSEEEAYTAREIEDTMKRFDDMENRMVRH